MRTTALVPRRTFLPSIDGGEEVPFLPSMMPSFSENPLAVIARQDKDLAARLVDNLSVRREETERSVAFLHSNVDIARSHCSTIAQAVVARSDRDHFRMTTTGESGRIGFFCNHDRRYLKVTTQLDMW
jgi:hypothetical protein